MEHETEAAEPLIDEQAANFLAQVLEANARQSQAITRSVEGSLRQSIEDWKWRYLALWNSVAEINERLDSGSLADLLRHTGRHADRAEQPEYWQTEEWKQKWGEDA